MARNSLFILFYLFKTYFNRMISSVKVLLSMRGLYFVCYSYTICDRVNKYGIVSIFSTLHDINKVYYIHACTFVYILMQKRLLKFCQQDILNN